MKDEEKGGKHYKHDVKEGILHKLRASNQQEELTNNEPARQSHREEASKKKKKKRKQRIWKLVERER